MKTCVVCIARLEGRYLQEFFDHYKSLGFTNVILCDNDHDGDEEDLEAILKPYNGFVIYEGCRNKENYQKQAYKEMYAKYKNDYDAFLFADVDELLVLNQHKSITEFLESFNNHWQVIEINWKCFTDSNLIHYDPRPLMERFNVPMEKDKCVQYFDIPENCHVKSIVKGGLEEPLIWLTPHVPANNLICYHANGRRCSNAPFQAIDWSVACINHYVTKTIEEYCTNKLKRGVGDRNYELFLYTYSKRFFMYNEKTLEKEEWLKSNGIQGI